MWVGDGQRSVRHKITFSSPFVQPPHVILSLSLMDADNSVPLRFDLKPENIDKKGFEVVFNTWLDSRFARVSVVWTAFGQHVNEDYWHEL